MFGYVLFHPADSSLTCSSVLAALDSVDIDFLKAVLDLPDAVMTEIKENYQKESDIREQLVNYYLNTHYLCSWQFIGTRLLLTEQNTALQNIRDTSRKTKVNSLLALSPIAFS